MVRMQRRWLTSVCVVLGLSATSGAAGQAPPAQAPAPAATAATEPAPTEEMLGIPIYPSAQFLRSYDAGRGQRFYLFGVLATHDEMVAYYRTILKQRGNRVFERPATHTFDVGRFRSETMAFQPGVTIKDFTSSGSGGFPNPVRGAQPERFPTIIQIVPAPALPR